MEDQREQQEQKFREMTQAPVGRLVGRLAFPCIISMLVTAFCNMADTFFVGMMDSNAATGFFSALAAVPCGVELPHPPGIPAGFHRDHPSLCPGVSAGHLTGHPVDDRLSGFEQPSGRPAGPAGIRSLHHPLRHPHPVPRSGRNGPGPGGQLHRTEKAGVPSGTPAFCVFLICRRSPWPLPRCAPRSGRTA